MKVKVAIYKLQVQHDKYYERKEKEVYMPTIDVYLFIHILISILITITVSISIVHYNSHY